MSITPEFVLQQLIERGLNAFRENNDLLDMLFRNFQQKDMQKIRDFFRDETVDIALNWPDAKIKAPSIIISLKNESESEAFLGNVIQATQNVDHTGTPFRKEELTAPATILGSGDQDILGHVREVLGGPYQATGGTTTTLTLPSGLQLADGNGLNRPNPFTWPSDSDGVLLVIREGTGAGQKRVVDDIAINIETGEVTVTVTHVFGTIPDATSIVEFVIESEGRRMVVGEPSKLFGPSEHVERLGQQYRVSYQLIIIGPDQAMTIILYAVVKSLFILNLNELQKHGFINPRLSGTDFTPSPEYFPHLAYSRSLVLEFDHTFDVYLTADALSQIQVDLNVFHPDVSDGSGVGRTVSSTTVDIS
jgi:hypothetical protein